ncbi:SEC-C motif-containing protein [Marininema mesophilum]|uniref:SEC-C motif-containing protein n=1 Tax=Marininema mesophilum TaxID=1048340 RepID=A0A1H2QMD1_9BACL|nr:SEC-C domain-containing protein [Marininema mesophilum]SDW08291.1 SEC-C motif-containing protein [Marininema mesophilum]
MAGRNDPCPCGSGKKYKRCCERVVAIQSAEKLREKRELQGKTELLGELDRWFEVSLFREVEWQWTRTFKEDLQLEVTQPLPADYTFTFRFWMLFDAFYMDGRRVVEIWKDSLEHKSEVHRQAEEMCNIRLDGYEVREVNGESISLCSFSDDQLYRVHLAEPVRPGMLMFARLCRLGNRHELFGPYTSFGDEMRGEMDVYLKNEAQKSGGLNREFLQKNSLQVVGGLMQRAREMDQLKKVIPAAPIIDETVPVIQEEEPRTLEQEPIPENHLPQGTLVSEEDRVVPDVVNQQMGQFELKFVSKFQEKTREYYGKSLILLKEYIATHFGRTFTWIELTEESLAHFFGVWYVERKGAGSIRSKILLNTLKGLFKWLQDEAICDVYTAFAKVYRSLIRSLPLALEARRWLKENGVLKGEDTYTPLEGIYRVSISSGGATLDMGERWVPVQMNLRGLPPTWMENWFWVKGPVIMKKNESYFTDIETVYPCLDVPQLETV